MIKKFNVYLLVSVFSLHLSFPSLAMEDDGQNTRIGRLRGYPSLEQVSFETARGLFQNVNDPSLRKLGRQIIKLIAEQDNHPQKYGSIAALLGSSKNDDKIFGKELLFRTLLTPQHIERSRAAEQLFRFTIGEDKLIGARVLARDEDPNLRRLRFDSAMFLRYYNQINQGDVDLAFEVFRFFSENNIDEYRYESAEEIFKIDNQSPLARGVFREIAGIPGHRHQFNSAKRLATQDANDEQIVDQRNIDYGIALNAYRFLANQWNEYQYKAAVEIFDPIKDEIPLALGTFQEFVRRNKTANDIPLSLEAFNEFIRRANSPYKSYGPGFAGGGYNIIPPVDQRIDPADVLLTYNNNNDADRTNDYKMTAYNYYQRFIKSYISEDRISVWIKLLKNGEDNGKMYARQSLINEPDIVFTEGNDDDKAFVRAKLRENVLLGGQYSVVGPKAARALFNHGNGDDRRYVTEQAEQGNRWAQQAITH